MELLVQATTLHGIRNIRVDITQDAAIFRSPLAVRGIPVNLGGARLPRALAPVNVAQISGERSHRRAASADRERGKTGRPQSNGTFPAKRSETRGRVAHG